MMRELPRINGRYWLTLIAASIFGTNTGDMISEYFHLGNVAGLPYLAALLAAVFLVERLSPWASAVYFWLAIIVIRTAATNVADATHTLGVWGIALLPVMLGGFVAAVWAYKRRVEAGPQAAGVPKVDLGYWTCMGLAGIVGTLLGDFGSIGFGLASWGVMHLAGAAAGFDFSWMHPGQLIATGVFGAAVIRMVARNSIADLAQPVKYWTLLALIRTAGTAAGDYLAHSGLGLAYSSVVTGLVFAALVISFYVVRTDNLFRLSQPR